MKKYGAGTHFARPVVENYVCTPVQNIRSKLVHIFNVCPFDLQDFTVKGGAFGNFNWFHDVYRVASCCVWLLHAINVRCLQELTDTVTRKKVFSVRVFVCLLVLFVCFDCCVDV